MSDSKGSVKKHKFPSGLSKSDAVMSRLFTAVRTMIEETQPTMGTVKGRERNDNKGGNVKVQIDGKDAREVGIPRQRGTTYRNGDRVRVQKNRGGEWQALGTIADGSGDEDERAVDNEQLHDNSVNGRVLANGSVTEGHLSGGIGKNKLAGDVQNSLKKADDALQKLPDDVAFKKDIPSVNGLAKDSRVDSLETRIKKLEDKLKKKDDK